MTPGVAVLWYLAIAAWWTSVLTAIAVWLERAVATRRVPLRNHVREVRRWGILWPISMPAAGIVVPALALFVGAARLSNRRR